MTSANLEKLVGARQLKAEKPDRREFDGLVRSGRARLADARVKELSFEGGLLTGGKLRVLAGSNICCAHHGFSVLLTASVGSRKHTLLFDAGPAAATFQRNAEILGVDFASIEAVVLSHGHWDHAGGLLAAVESIARSRGSKSFSCYVHPGR